LTVHLFICLQKKIRESARVKCIQYILKILNYSSILVNNFCWAVGMGFKILSCGIVSKSLYYKLPDGKNVLVGMSGVI
jgi:hypothetical protein